MAILFDFSHVTKIDDGICKLETDDRQADVRFFIDKSVRDRERIRFVYLFSLFQYIVMFLLFDILKAPDGRVSRKEISSNMLFHSSEK